IPISRGNCAARSWASPGKSRCVSVCRVQRIACTASPLDASCARCCTCPTKWSYCISQSSSPSASRSRVPEQSGSLPTFRRSHAHQLRRIKALLQFLRHRTHVRLDENPVMHSGNNADRDASCDKITPAVRRVKRAPETLPPRAEQRHMPVIWSRNMLLHRPDVNPPEPALVLWNLRHVHHVLEVAIVPSRALRACQPAPGVSKPPYENPVPPRRLQLSEILKPVKAVAQKLKRKSRRPPTNAIVAPVTGVCFKQRQQCHPLPLLTKLPGHLVGDVAAEAVAAQEIRPARLDRVQLVQVPRCH